MIGKRQELHYSSVGNQLVEELGEREGREKGGYEGVVERRKPGNGKACTMSLRQGKVGR